MKRKKKARKSFFSRYWLEFALGAVIFALAFAIWALVSEQKVDQGEQYVRSEIDEVQRPEQIIEENIPTEKKGPGNAVKIPPAIKPDQPVIALIIDDMGGDPEAAEKLLAIDAPLTFSILPHLKFSHSTAMNAERSGRTVMLHLPMEPQSDAAAPGPGVLLMKQDDNAAIKTLTDDIETVPGAVGVNNHMGSLLTKDREKMALVMRELKRRSLFFIDSRTTAETVAYNMAQEYGVPSAKRDVFLDNERDVGKISENILSLADKAIKKGYAIGIGHPHLETIDALESTIPAVRKMGVRIVPVTELLNR